MHQGDQVGAAKLYLAEVRVTGRSGALVPASALTTTPGSTLVPANNMPERRSSWHSNGLVPALLWALQ